MDVLEFLKIKSIIKNVRAEYKWKIKRYGGHEDTCEQYTLCLDDGGQTYRRIYFDKNKYDLKDVYCICEELCELLNIEFKSFNTSEEY